MHRAVQSLIFLVALSACRDTGSGADRGPVPDVATRTGGAEGGEPGVEFEAPRLIPAVRAQITEVRDPAGASEGNVAAFKGGVGALVNAMQADLNRVGVTDTGRFYALSDSALRQIGGGPGGVPDMSPEEVRQATLQVERLIEIYEERMRNVAD